MDGYSNITAGTALHHLRAAQRILDQLPHLAATSARLAVVIDGLEEEEADRILKNVGTTDTDVQS